MPKRPSKKSANHLRAWREKRGLSQEALAKLVGTAGNVISLLESGDRALSDKWLRKLAPALGTTAGFLLDHDPNDIDASSSLLEAVLAVPKEQHSQVLRILETFKPTGTEG
jgi:transcriptional regulator with XRE-family HTH domain